MTGDRWPAGTAEASPPASRLTALDLERLIFPRRSRLGWGLAIGTSCLSFGTLLTLVLLEKMPGGDWVFGLALAVVALLPAALYAFPAISGALVLSEDRSSGRLAGLGMSLIHYQALLAAYHRRALATGLLFYATLVPWWILSGRAPHPLIFARGVIWGQLEDIGIVTIPRFLSGAISDTATIYLAAALGLGALVWTRSKGWTVVLGPIAALLFGAAGWGLGWGMTAGMQAMDLRYYSPAWIFGSPVEPGYTLLLWTFSVVYSTAAYLTGRAVLGAAARRLDRLVTD